jgi:predicted DNA-binding protein (UPF0251 family)
MTGHLKSCRELPASRAECADLPRPCPMVSCRFHLLLDVAKDGRLYKTHQFDEHSADSVLSALESMQETCALDVAEWGGVYQEDAAKLMNMSRRWLDEVEQEAKRKAAGRIRQLEPEELEFNPGKK